MNRIRRIRKIMIRAAIGAAIGGSVASLLAMIIVQPRADAFKVLGIGTGGFVGGAICGVAVGASDKEVAALGGAIGGIGGCILMTMFTCLYVAIPWPSPRAYPGVEATIDKGSGCSCGLFRSQTYTVTLSLDDMQQYYEDQMNRYCVSTWQFGELLDYEGYSLCRQAACDIRRLWLEQYFRVRLCSVSETETVVTQVDMWQY